MIIWAIVVAVVALAAVVATYFFIARRLELNNALMRDICAKAQADGDSATVNKCIEATRDIQVSTPWEGVTKEVGKVALILGAGYLAFRYGLPFLIDQGVKVAGKLSGKTATANVRRLSSSQSKRRVAELRRQGCEVEEHEMPNGDIVVLKRCT